MMRLSRTLSLVLGSVLAGLAAGRVSAEADQGWFVFAENRIADFELQAKTEWNARNSPPHVRGVMCSGNNEDVHFYVGANGGIEHLFSEFAIGRDKKGNLIQGMRGGDVLWLHIDRKSYELRFIPKPDSRFSNLPYTPVNSDEIVLQQSGTYSVRAAESEPFRPLSSLYEQIVAASRLEWSMKVATPRRERHPNFDPKRRYLINILGLRHAVEWCRHQVASPAARKLPPELLKSLSRGESD